MTSYGKLIPREDDVKDTKEVAVTTVAKHTDVRSLDKVNAIRAKGRKQSK